MVYITFLMSMGWAELMYEFCIDDNECPNDKAPNRDIYNGDKCALMVSSFDLGIVSFSWEYSQCMDEKICGQTDIPVDMVDPNDGETYQMNASVYCGGAKFWFNNKTWIIIIIVLMALLILGALLCCFCRRSP